MFASMTLNLTTNGFHWITVGGKHGDCGLYTESYDKWISLGYCSLGNTVSASMALNLTTIGFIGLL